jgi:hypothetical protein
MTEYTLYPGDHFHFKVNFESGKLQSFSIWGDRTEEMLTIPYRVSGLEDLYKHLDYYNYGKKRWWKKFVKRNIPTALFTFGV